VFVSVDVFGGGDIDNDENAKLAASNTEAFLPYKWRLRSYRRRWGDDDPTWLVLAALSLGLLLAVLLLLFLL
jgi:hypothetical protein